MGSPRRSGHRFCRVASFPWRGGWERGRGDHHVLPPAGLLPMVGSADADRWFAGDYWRATETSLTSPDLGLRSRLESPPSICCVDCNCSMADSLVSGSLVVTGAAMLDYSPKSGRTWAIVILVFSLAGVLGGSFSGTYIGSFFGVIGETITFLWKSHQLLKLTHTGSAA